MNEIQAYRGWLSFGAGAAAAESNNKVAGGARPKM